MDQVIIPLELTKTMPTQEAIRLLKFDELNNCGLPSRDWGSIEVSVTPYMGNWVLSILMKQRSARSIYLPQQICVGLNMTPIDILSMIYSTCETYFKSAELKLELPKELLWGKVHSERNWEKKRIEEEKRPKIWAERDFLRFCLSYINRYNDWSEEDYEVSFSYSSNQLKISARGFEICCPARGNFNGILTISARNLYRKLPKRFNRKIVVISIQSKKQASIAFTKIPAKWVEIKTDDQLFINDQECLPLTDQQTLNLDSQENLLLKEQEPLPLLEEDESIKTPLMFNSRGWWITVVRIYCYRVELTPFLQIEAKWWSFGELSQDKRFNYEHFRYSEVYTASLTLSEMIELHEKYRSDARGDVNFSHDFQLLDDVLYKDSDLYSHFEVMAAEADMVT